MRVDSAEALELFADESIRVVVSDVIMPDLSGLELLEAVRVRRRDRCRSCS